MSDIADKYAGTPLAMPAGTVLSDSRQPFIIALNIIGIALAAICVGLRILSRFLSDARFGLDDWLMFPALLSAAVWFCFGTLWMIPKGVGHHIWVTGDVVQALQDFNFGLFMLELSFTGTIFFVKFSILAFYKRIFQVESIKWPIYILCAVVMGWGIGLWFATIFQCLPVRAFWDKTIEAECHVNVTAFFIGNAVPNILTDLALMILPLPYIFKLQLRPAQKLALCGVFAMGTFVVVISSTRLSYLLNMDLVSVDVTWNFVDTFIWTSMESYIAVICACLPSLRPILQLVFSTAMKTRTRSRNLNLTASGDQSGRWGTFGKSSNATPSKATVRGKEDDEDCLFEGPDRDSASNGRVTTITTAPVSERTLSESDVELGEIQSRNGVQVRTDIRVEWSRKV